MSRPSILLALAGLSACSWGYDGYGYPYGDYAYRGSEWRDHAARDLPDALTGPGVEILDDWLKGTREGRAIVTLGFRDAGTGEVSEDVAHRANIWFRRYADSNRDRVITDPEIRTALVAAASRYTR